MSLKLNDINGEASEWAWGFKATSRSLKPVHLAQVLFSHTVGHVYDADHLFAFTEKPSKTPSSELPSEVTEKFEFNRREKTEQLDQLRQTLRKVLDNDNALYATQGGSAPTSASDWFLTNPRAGTSVGRFLYSLIQRAGGELEPKLKDQLTDHHDSISVLFRPLLTEADKDTPAIKTWGGPDADDPYANEKVATDLTEGYRRIGAYLKAKESDAVNYPRDLRRVVKFGGFAFYVYMANRQNEIRKDSNKRETRLPLVFNYTDGTENPVASASLECYDTVSTEVQATSRLGIQSVLDTQGYQDKIEYDEEGILTKLEERDLLDLNRKSEQKIEEDYQTFRYIFEGDPADDVFDRLVNTVSDAIHQSRYKTYTPVDTIQTYGWRAGLLKPRGNRANERRYTPDPEMLEPILLSVLEPAEQISLKKLCERLRTRYGIIVGGTEEDRSHLDAWDITIGASSVESDPLSNRNYESFKQAVIDLGYAREFADGVTIVSTTDQ